MKDILKVIILSLSIVQYAHGQKVGIINNVATQFSLQEQNDTIDFVVFDTTLNQRKPVLLFCQGSMPIPLFIELSDGSVFSFGGGVSNFDLPLITKEFHLVVISMPQTPVYCKKSQLNKSWSYVTDTANQNSFKESYLRSDYIENYVNRAERVLNYLKNQEWIDSNKLVVFGHSQGSKIATKLASNKTNNITQVGLFGANPFGRIDQSIRQIRKDESLGKISCIEAETKINAEYENWKSKCNPRLREMFPFLISWYSFSQPTINDLLKIEIPIYMSYGTEDITSELCDLVPLMFIQNGKENLTIKRHWGLEHNFFEVDENKKIIVEKGHWKEVMNEFIEWTKN